MEHLGVEFKGFLGETMSGEASDHHVPSEGLFDWGSLEGELSRVHLVIEGVKGDELVCDLGGLWGLGFEDLGMDLLEGFEVWGCLEEVQGRWV